MSATTLAQVEYQIQKFWAELFMKELRESTLLPSLVSREYEGSIRQLGDQVTVSQINAPAGQTLTVGVDADQFSTSALSTSYVQIKADKRFVAAIEMVDLVDIQSQLGAEGSEIRQSLLFAMNQQINDYLYSLVAASSSSPDHVISGVTDLNAAQLSALRILAGQAKWPKSKPWYLLADPVFYGDMCDDTTLSSADFNAGDPVVVAGEIATKRYGFNVFEDNKLPADHAVAFYPDFMHFVTQTQPQFKMSDMHAIGKFGYKLSVDLIGGAKLGIDGSKKHIQIYNSSWAPNA